MRAIERIRTENPEDLAARHWSGGHRPAVQIALVDAGSAGSRAEAHRRARPRECVPAVGLAVAPYTESEIALVATCEPKSKGEHACILALKESRLNARGSYRDSLAVKHVNEVVILDYVSG